MPGRLLVVYAQNGEALRPEQGFPLRLLVPGWEGNVSVKWLRRIKLGDKPWFTREETSKYTDLMADGTARGFTWVKEAKSVITFPCPEKPLSGAGLYEIRGLAWSGRGKVKAVDVSLDGGVNWTRAELKEPVLAKALTRFTLAMALGRQAGAAAIARRRRDRICAADHRAVAQGARHEFDLSQQFDPDLAGQARRERAQCAACLAGCPALAIAALLAALVGRGGVGRAARPLRLRPAGDAGTDRRLGHRCATRWRRPAARQRQSLSTAPKSLPTQCAGCHGTFGEGAGRYPKLAGGEGTLTRRPSATDSRQLLAVRYHFIRLYQSRQPYTAPHSLSANDVYAVTAYVLNLNDIVANNFIADRNTLPKLNMANHGGFTWKDPRPDTSADGMHEGLRRSENDQDRIERGRKGSNAADHRSAG